MNTPFEFDSVSGDIQRIPYTPSEFYNPNAMVGTEKDLIVSTPDGAHAIGIKRPNTGYGIGFWGGAGNYSNKWVGGKPVSPFAKGDYSWTFFMAVGTITEVRDTLYKLARMTVA